MKKVLLATTALTMSAGVAYAEVSFSGGARMGLQYKSAVAESSGYAGAVSGLVAAQQEVTAAEVDVANAAAGAAARLTAAQSGLVTATEALAAESAAVAAGTTFEKRMDFNVSGSAETTSGLTFGAEASFRANEGYAAAWSGARVSMATNGFTLAMGNIYGAIDSMPGLYSPNVGLTGGDWSGMAVNTVAKGSWGWDSYSMSGNGNEGVEVMYSAGGFAGHLSYTDADSGSSGTRTAAYGAYTMGDWTVAVGYQDSAVATEDKTVVTVGGKVGDFKLGFSAADNDGETKMVLNGSATMGAVTVSAYAGNEESASDNPMGLGFAYDLGGASLKGGVMKTASGQTRADMGVSFSF